MKIKIFKNKYFITVFLITAVFLLINTFNLSKYGETIDENFSVQRGKATVEYINQVIKTGNLDFKIWNKQIQSHPPFFATINYWFSNLLRNFLNFGYVESYHFLIVILFSIGLFFTFLLGKSMFNEKVGIFAVLFLALYPRLIAHSHYNPKDIPVMVFSLLAIFFLYQALQKQNKIFSILAGVFGAMAVTSKLTGLFIIPIFFSSYILNLTFLRKKWETNLKKDLLIFIIFLISLTISVFLFWPYLWKDPLFLIKSLHHFSNIFTTSHALYFGKVYPAHNTPWHYIPFSLFLITPTIILVLFLIGVFSLFKKILIKEKLFEFLLLAFWILIPLFAMSAARMKYDGSRQLFIVIPALIITAAFGLTFLFKKIDIFSAKYNKKIKILIILFIVFFLFHEIIIIHPFEGAYVNEIIRLFIPEHIEKYFFLDIWTAVYKQAVEWLNVNAEPNSQICFFMVEHTAWHYQKRKDLTFKCDSNNDYIVTNTRFGIKYEEKYPIVFRISIYKNSDLLYIYKKK